MKIIFSRKGFDSSYGGVASPVFPDGKMLSLPIPSKDDQIKYADLNYDGVSVGKIVADLTGKAKYCDYNAHFDPDLNEALYPRQQDWKPIFGQVGAAQSHLDNHGIGTGDIFLYFGWFRRVELCGGTYRFEKGAPNMHVLFGWLQIGEKISIPSQAGKLPLWSEYHPHHPNHNAIPAKKNNTIYISSDKLVLDGINTDLPGAGAFKNFSSSLQLSQTDNRSLWTLPKWIYPDPATNKKPLTYHTNPLRWRFDESNAILDTVKIGQEFVLYANDYPEASGWLKALIKNNAK